MGISFDDGDYVDAARQDSPPPGDVTADEAPAMDLRNANSTTDAELATLANIADAADMHGTGLSQEAVAELGADIITGELTDNDPIYQGLAARGISKDAVHGTIQNMVDVVRLRLTESLVRPSTTNSADWQMPHHRSRRS